MLPRKATGLARSRDSLRAVAFQIGTLLAIQRNRGRMTQDFLGKVVGIDQIDISRVENGQPLAVTDAKIDALFGRLGLSGGEMQANFVKWWRDNAV